MPLRASKRGAHGGESDSSHGCGSRGKSAFAQCNASCGGKIVVFMEAPIKSLSYFAISIMMQTRKRATQIVRLFKEPAGARIASLCRKIRFFGLIGGSIADCGQIKERDLT